MKTPALLSTKAHGIIDYIFGVTLIVTPFVMGFDDDRAATWVLVIAGFGAILYSLLTDYELGVYRRIPMLAHLTLDVVAGAFLTVSPWLFGFTDRISSPHLLAGMISLIIPVLTTRYPGDRPVNVQRH